jgi:hypothetical protein
VTSPAVRTPEERFQDPPGFAFRPSHREDQGPEVGRLIADWLTGEPT